MKRVLFALVIGITLGTVTACELFKQENAGALQQAGNDLQSVSTQPGVPTKAGDTISKTGKIVGDVGNNIAAGQDPVMAVLSAAAVAAGPYGWIAALLGIGYSLVKKNQTKQVTAGAKSITDGVAAGIASGKITVAPGATAVVDSAVNGHPITDSLVDVIAHAGGGTIPAVK